VQRRVLIARRELQVAVHGVDAVVPLSEETEETKEAVFRQFHSSLRRESVRPRGAIENESVEFDIRPTRGVSACRARPTLRAGVFRAALRDRAFESSQRARVPATASSRSRSCPRNTPSALRSGTLSWREIAASNARLRRRTRARGRGESSTRRRRRTASSFDSRRTSGSGAGPKRGSTQGSSPCDRRSDDACDEAGVMTRQRRTSKYAGRVKKAVPTNQIADVSLPVSRRRAGIASRWR
jgi:hypothetical protein